SKTCSIAVAFFISSIQAHAWEETYPAGPVRTTARPLIRFFTPTDPTLTDIRSFGYQPLTGNINASDYVPPASAAFANRTVPYPAREGAELGRGWDFITNEKKSTSCIIFSEADDNKYQNATVGVQQSIDEETINVLLNAQLSGGVGGDIGIVSAKAEATTTINA